MKAYRFAGKKVPLTFLMLPSKVLFVVSIMGLCLMPWRAAQAPQEPVVSNAPSLAQLDAAIARAESYITSLYKPLDESTATLAEYYGFPLRVYLTGPARWVLAGEDVRGRCVTDLGTACFYTTSLSEHANQYSSESFIVDFRSPKFFHTPKIRAEINWNYTPTSYRATVINEQFDDPDTTAQVYLSDRYIDTFSRANIGKRTTLTIDKADTRLLQTFRYTIRHGNQEGQNYYWYKGDRDKFEKLVNFQTQSGFRLDYDVRAPIWGYGASYPDDMPYHINGNNGEDVYHDCQISPAKNNLSYTYESKICKVGAGVYAKISAGDTLVPAIQAMHVLNKYKDPNRVYLDSRNNPNTALDTAIDLEQIFDQSGFGMPICTEVGCNYGLASGIRTFGFGALETRLGYQYGRETSKAYADAVARLVLQVQIAQDGIIRTAIEGDYYRPVQTGAFYLSWDQALKYRMNKPFGYRQLDSALNMPAEYIGVVVSNMETTHDAYAFLVLYRCQTYGVGCAPDQPKPIDTIAELNKR